MSPVVLDRPRSPAANAEQSVSDAPLSTAGLTMSTSDKFVAAREVGNTLYVAHAVDDKCDKLLEGAFARVNEFKSKVDDGQTVTLTRGGGGINTVHAIALEAVNEQLNGSGIPDAQRGPLHRVMTDRITATVSAVQGQSEFARRAEEQKQVIAEQNQVATTLDLQHSQNAAVPNTVTATNGVAEGLAAGQAQRGTIIVAGLNNKTALANSES